MRVPYPHIAPTPTVGPSLTPRFPPPTNSRETAQRTSSLTSCSSTPNLLLHPYLRTHSREHTLRGLTSYLEHAVFMLTSMCGRVTTSTYYLQQQEWWRTYTLQLACIVLTYAEGDSRAHVLPYLLVHSRETAERTSSLTSCSSRWDTYVLTHC